MATRRSVSKDRAITAAADRIGDALSEWRRAQRLTQAELAQRAHTSISTIAKIESGNPTVSMSTILSVVHTLGLLDRVVEGFDPLRSDFGAALITDELPKRVRRRG